MKISNSWTPEEDARIFAELDRGRKPWVIARDLSAELGRTKRAVDTRTRALRKIPRGRILGEFHG